MGFFMRLRGEGAPSVGNAGLVDALSEIFSPSKKHTAEQQQYDSRVGRREQTSSGRPLDFDGNKIDIVVPKSPPEGEQDS